MPADARPAFATFSPAMVVCFLLCGFVPGLVTTAFCALVTYCIFIPPFWSFAHKPAGEVATALFILSSVMIGLIIRHLRHKEHVLRQSSAKQNAILDADLLGVATTQRRRIVWANRGLEQLLGYGPGEMAGLATRARLPRR